MAEEKKLVIKFMGKEVKDKQLHIRKYKSGRVEYTIYNKKLVVVLHSNGVKNIIAVESIYGKIFWTGTYNTDTQIRSIDIVWFTDEYMRKFNSASVVTTEGKRFQILKFNYFETELLPETSMQLAEDMEIEEDEEIEETEDEETIAAEEAEAEQMRAVEQTVKDLMERSGLTD